MSHGLKPALSPPRNSGGWQLSLRLLARDWKSGELLVLMVALVIAVTSLTAVSFLTSRVGQAVEMRAAASLAADLRLSASTPLDARYLQLADEAGVRTAQMISMPSVVFAGGSNTLAAIRAVSDGYPLRGALKTSDRLLDPAIETTDVPAPGEAWAATSLLARLGAEVGTEIEVGQQLLTITRVLNFRPDEGWSFVDLAPTLLMNVADMDATGLIAPGSRVSYQQLFAADRAVIQNFKSELGKQISRSERLRDIEDSSPQIRSAMDRAGRFLNLASLISVLLSAIAVAMAARRYSHRHRDRVALMKCLGASQAFIMRVNVAQLLLLALSGALLGIALGYAGQQSLAWLLRDFIGDALPAPGWQPVWLGLVTALTILAGFALPDLAQMGRTPPLRVLRQDIDPPAMRQGLGLLAAVAAVLVLLGWMVRDVTLVASVAAGSLVTFLALGAAGWLLVRAMQGFRGAGGAAWRFGLANLARRGRESIVQVVAFGLGIMVLLVLTMVRNDIMDSWRASLPVDAPNRFIINIQPQEVEPIGAFLAERGIDTPGFVPMVRARMTQLNGTDVTQLTFEDPQGERWARREANLTFADQPAADNTLVKGEWWPSGTDRNEVSVEVDFAEEMALELGDELTFDIAGEPLTVTVTSFRTVEWDSFRPNFFMVMTPAALQDRPGTWINSIYLPAGSEATSIELMRAFPTVTVIDLDAILGQVRDVMDRAAFAVQAVFVFTLLAGLAVLWAAVQATRDEREFESAMLRAMGASRKRVFTGVATEFLAIGLLAGVLATAGATLAAYLLATRVYQLDYQFNLALTLAGPVLGMVFVGIAGMLATRKVIDSPPGLVLKAA
jgi:putative ABC transport system permease protein